MEKRKRVKMELQEKLKIIKMIEVDKLRITHVARMYNRNESSIRQILRIKDKIKANATLYPHHVQVSDCPRKKLMLQVENEIYKWLDDLKEDDILVNTNVISAKALELYDNLAKSYVDLKPNSKLFMASKNWVNNCLSRYSMRKSQPIMPNFIPAVPDVLSNPVSNTLLTDLERLIHAENVVPKQIFCVDEFGLFWKRLPKRCSELTSVDETVDLNCNRDRMTLIMCGNAVGHIIKPGLIYRKQHPCGMKNKIMNCLPVFWMSNKKMRVTVSLFLEWFQQCFKPAVKMYLAREQLEFKVILIVNKTPWHPVSLVTEDEHIKIFYLPSPFNVQFQPMDQGILNTFKINYFKEMFEMLKIAHQNEENILSAWNSFSLVDALKCIHQALNNLDTKCFIACWQHLPLPYKKQIPTKITKKQDMENLLKIAHKVPLPGFFDMKMTELKMFLDSHDDFVNSKDVEIINKSSQDSDSESEFEKVPPSWNIRSLDSILQLANTLKQQMIDNDPNLERSMSINQQITDALKPLAILLEEMKQQTEQNYEKKRQYTEKRTATELFNASNEPQLDIENIKKDFDEEDPFRNL